MLEILYDTATLEVRAWNADETVQGNFKPTPNQAVVILPIEPPVFPSDRYKVDLVNQTITGDPPYADPDLERIRELLANPPTAITMPEIWELLHLISRRLGYYPPD